MRKRAAMTRTPILLALAAACVSLTACEGETLGADDRGSRSDVSASDGTPVVLPPSIVASHVYRCRDNSLVYVEWLSDDTARIKQQSTARGATVTKGEDGTYASDDKTLAGEPNSQSITINGQTCRR
jgi:hypothetical protein